MLETIQLFVGLVCFFGSVVAFGLISLWIGCNHDNDKF